MAGFIGNLKILQQFLTKLSWGKIAQLFVLFLVLLSGWITFQTRDDITRFVSTGHFERTMPLRTLSKKTTDELDLTVSKIDVIVGIVINSIDFKTNTRHVVYMSTTNPDLKRILSNHPNVMLDQPLFTNNADQNKRIISLINGDFVCGKYILTAGSMEMPETRPFIDTVCANSIPPYYGKIVGTISIFVKKEPSNEEIDQIRVLSKGLSATIYNNELK